MLLKKKLSSSTLLNLFLDWIFEATIFQINNSSGGSDASTSSIDNSTKNKGLLFLIFKMNGFK
jgi:hypothetical protein